jgi:hypothetical protein
LSFFLLARTPDAALLDMADNGELDSPEALRGLALELLSSDDAWPALASFYDELFRLRFLEEGTPKNATTFPSWTTELARDMRTETLLFLQEVVWESEGNMLNMYDAPFTFLNDALATHYGVTPPGSGSQFVKTDWPASQNRAGVTSQGSFLAHQAGPLRNSPTKRGKFVLNFLMCKSVPPPPDNVVPELPEDPNNELTLQELLEQHMEDPACNTCHGVTDPVGFAFEHFDAIGRARTTDETGKAVDGYGTIPEFDGEWENAEDLALLLAAAPDAATCIIQNFIRGRIGHTETKGEDPAIARLDASFVESEYKLRELLAEFTANQLFRYVGEAK